MKREKLLSWWRQKEKQIKQRLRGSYIHKIIGDRLFTKRIWAKDKSALAGGLSLGLFVAFTPTMPFHMILCTIGSILLGVNMPIALIACWATNPLTAIPIYMSAYKLGHYLFIHYEIIGLIMPISSLTGHTGKLIEQSFYLWTGSLIFSAISALIGNVAVRLTWNILKIRDRQDEKPLDP
ncbi:MAG: hypothetical protein B5M56_02225 [Desulfococcus sp. 4484_241]|nr:MAG: hypothetical protein B5M56_02225 [Desulfococcus sp. 4484_241]RLC33678.1 MAG: hypothetical protein DRH32_00575 [Deltaproteobacteria bacterium]